MAVDFKTLAKKYGTPLYIYNFDQIVERLTALRGSLLPDIKIYYAVKANSNLKLLSELRPLIDGLDISSGGEIEQSLLAGYSGSQMSFAGPGKTAEEITIALNNDCASLSIESLDELQRVLALSKKLNRRANVSLRINPLQLINKFAVKMGGKATQFGLDEESLTPAIELLKKEAGALNFIGYHVYAGTQCLDAESLAENFKYIFEMINKLISRHELFPQKINVGGGFGIPYFTGQAPLDLVKACTALNSEFSAFQTQFPQTTCLLELGRYLVGEAGHYLTKVVAIKNSRNKKYLITDGGMHHNFSAAGHLGQIIKKNYRITNLSTRGDATEKVDVVGALCTPLDTLATNTDLPVTAVDDYLSFSTSGAYGYTSSPLFFLGHPTPREILIKNGQDRLIREAKKLTDLN